MLHLAFEKHHGDDVIPIPKEIYNHTQWLEWAHVGPISALVLCLRYSPPHEATEFLNGPDNPLSK